MHVDRRESLKTRHTTRRCLSLSLLRRLNFCFSNGSHSIHRRGENNCTAPAIHQFPLSRVFHPPFSFGHIFRMEKPKRENEHSSWFSMPNCFRGHRRLCYPSVSTKMFDCAFNDTRINIYMSIYAQNIISLFNSSSVASVKVSTRHNESR